MLDPRLHACWGHGQVTLFCAASGGAEGCGRTFSPKEITLVVLVDGSVASLLVGWRVMARGKQEQGGSGPAAWSCQWFFRRIPVRDLPVVHLSLPKSRVTLSELQSVGCSPVRHHWGTAQGNLLYWADHLPLLTVSQGTTILPTRALTELLARDEKKGLRSRACSGRWDAVAAH